MTRNLVGHAIVGAGLGFALSHIGFSSWDEVHRMFTFADLIRVNDRGIQNLLKSVDASRLSLALKTAGPELREKFFRNMSKRAVERIKEEMELMGPVRVADVQAGQHAIADEVMRLEEAGELVIEGRGGAEAVVT